MRRTSTGWLWCLFKNNISHELCGSHTFRPWLNISFFKHLPWAGQGQNKAPAQQWEAWRTHRPPQGPSGFTGCSEGASLLLVITTQRRASPSLGQAPHVSERVSCQALPLKPACLQQGIAFKPEVSHRSPFSPCWSQRVEVHTWGGHGRALSCCSARFAKAEAERSRPGLVLVRELPGLPRRSCWEPERSSLILRERGRWGRVTRWAGGWRDAGLTQSNTWDRLLLLGFVPIPSAPIQG